MSQIWFYKKTHHQLKIHMRNPKIHPPHHRNHIFSPLTGRQLPGPRLSNRPMPPNPYIRAWVTFAAFTILRYSFVEVAPLGSDDSEKPPKSAIPFGVFHDKPSILGYVPLSLKGGYALFKPRLTLGKWREIMRAVNPGKLVINEVTWVAFRNGLE